jgi:ATP-binding cassette subfamily G (WHITE) protein 1
MYGLTAYFLTKNLIDIPVLLISPLIALSIVFWGIGFYNTWDTFWGFYLAIMLVGQSAAGLGFMISTSVDNVATASAVSSLITLPTILFGGLFVNDSSVFKALSWIQYISPIRYGFQNLAISQWKP